MGQGEAVVNLDLSTTNRSPGQVPTKGGSWYGPSKVMDAIRMKAKQALPAAPASALPVPTAPAFKLGVLGWSLVGLAGYMILFRRKQGNNG